MEVSFDLPGAKTTQTLLTWIVNRRLAEDAVLYGLQFDTEQSRDFSGQQEDIITYIMQRQREELQQMAHLRP